MPEGLSTIDMKTFNFSLNLAFESSVKYQLVIYYRVFERKFLPIYIEISHCLGKLFSVN